MIDKKKEAKVKEDNQDNQIVDTKKNEDKMKDDDMQAWT